MLRRIIYFYVYIILDFSITYRNASVLLSIRLCMSTSNSKYGSFVIKIMKIPVYKGEHS